MNKMEEERKEKQDSQDQQTTAANEPAEAKQEEKKLGDLGTPKEQKDSQEAMPEKSILETPQTLTKEISEKMPEKSNRTKEWMNEIGWSRSPFTFSIVPELFVGYIEQVNSIVTLLEEKHKVILLVGPTGSGKTTLLKWVSGNLPEEFDYIFIGKPPERAEEFVDIFNEKFRVPWYKRLFTSNIKNIHQIPEKLNKKLKKHLVIMFDEAHESSIDVLEWLRVFSDQVNNMSVLIAGLPSFDEKLSELETLRKRIVTKTELISLTKEETTELIRKRIASVGGKDLRPFNADIISEIYEKTGGFPREVIRICNDLVNKAVKAYKFDVTRDMLIGEKAEEKKVSLDILDRMTPLQKEIMQLLSKGAYTPGEVANSLDLSKYKSRQHAVRSINNIMKRLMAEGFLERSKRDKAYIYSLVPQLKTILIKS